MTITVVGTGFVGVVTAGVFASFGHRVYGLDVDEKKIHSLKKGVIPFFEPGLAELIAAQQAAGRVEFTHRYQEAIPQSEVIFIAVGTPSQADGQADLRYVLSAVESLSAYVQPEAIVVLKSTVPPGTNKIIEKLLKEKVAHQVYVASMPEFLREGTAVYDTQHPDRILIGSRHSKVSKVLSDLHSSFNAPILVLSPESAQMAKYTANSYLATRITFINQVADLCEHNGADIQQVIQAIGADRRIGDHYWYPGLGYGGSCFPKDVKELAAYSRSVGEADNLFNKIDQLNDDRPSRLVRTFAAHVDRWQDKTVAVLGLAFKPNTDDTREAPSLKVIPALLDQGARVRAYDPLATLKSQITAKEYHELRSIEDAISGADVIMVLVEWPEFIQFAYPDVSAMEVVFIDVRNQFDPGVIKKKGYTYLGVGR